MAAPASKSGHTPYFFRIRISDLHELGDCEQDGPALGFLDTKSYDTCGIQTNDQFLTKMGLGVGRTGSVDPGLGRTS